MLKVIWDYEGFTYVPRHSKKVVEKRYLEIINFNKKDEYDYDGICNYCDDKLY